MFLNVEEISSDKSYERGHYIHVFLIKNVLVNVNTRLNGYRVDQLEVIRKVFHMQGLTVEDWEGLDLKISSHTGDKTAEQSINRSKYLLKALDKLIGLKLEE